MKFSKIKNITIAIIIASGICINLSVTAIAEQNTNLELGIQFLDNKDLNQAVRYLKAAAENEPGNAKVHYNLAMAYKSLGMLDESLAEFELVYKAAYPESEKSLTINKPEVLKNETLEKEDVKTAPVEIMQTDAVKQIETVKYKPSKTLLDEDYSDMADMYFDNKDYKSSVEYYNYALEQDTENDYVIYKMAQSNFELNKIDLAKQQIEHALKIMPDNKNYQAFQAKLFTPDYLNEQNSAKDEVYSYSSDYYNQKGIEYFNNSDFVSAEKYFNKAVELDSLCAKAFNNLGNIEFQRQNPDKSIEYYLKAVNADSGYTEAYYNLALVYKQKQDKVKESEFINKTITSNISFYQAYYLRASEAYKAGNISSAIADFKKVLEIKPDHLNALINLGTISANLGNLNEAVDYLNKAQKIDDKNSEIYYQLALILQVQGNYTDSVIYLQKVSELNPNDYRVFLNLGKNYLRSNDYENAKKSLTKASELNNKVGDIYNYLGLAYSRLKEYDSAIDLFNKALTFNNRPIYHYNLSQSYLALNDNNKSILEFQNAIKNLPLTYQDYMDLSEIYEDKGMSDYAVDLLKDGIRKFPENEYFYLALSKTYEKSGHVDKSREVLQNLVKITPQSILRFKIKEKLEQ